MSSEEALKKAQFIKNEVQSHACSVWLFFSVINLVPALFVIIDSPQLNWGSVGAWLIFLALTFIPSGLGAVAIANELPHTNLLTFGEKFGLVEVDVNRLAKQLDINEVDEPIKL